MATRTITYGSATAITITLASLATSSGLTVGRQSTAIDFSSANYEDVIIGGIITTGTSPTSGGVIELWFLPQLPTGNMAPGVGTSDAALTLATDFKWGFARPLATQIVTATSDTSYPLRGSLRAAFGGAVIPPYGVVWVVHSTGVNLNSTAGNHSIYYRGAVLAI